MKADLFFSMSCGRKLKHWVKEHRSLEDLRWGWGKNQTVLLRTLQTLLQSPADVPGGFQKSPRNRRSKSQYVSADVTEAHLYFLDETRFNYVLNVSDALFHNKVCGWLLCCVIKSQENIFSLGLHLMYKNACFPTFYFSFAFYLSFLL